REGTAAEGHGVEDGSHLAAVLHHRKEGWRHRAHAGHTARDHLIREEGQLRFAWLSFARHEEIDLRSTDVEQLRAGPVHIQVVAAQIGGKVAVLIELTGDWRGV